MAVTTLSDVPWRRHHDPHDQPVRPKVPQVHCPTTVADFIQLCQARPASGLKLKAAGSHWSLSTGTLSDDSALETHWPDSAAVPAYSGLAVDMADLINDRMLKHLINNPPTPPDQATSDPCWTDGPIRNFFFVHLKSGTRVYEAYSLLDQMDQQPTQLARQLNAALTGNEMVGPYSGPWAIATLGGAGGQTVFGALTTGTHGGDFRQPPIADYVAAVHLVTDGGDHYWIEPKHLYDNIPLTDDARLQQVYGQISPGVRFSIIRDDDIFNAVIVGVGRFGVVVSLVMRVVAQFSLLEHRRLANWSRVKAMLKGPQRHYAFSTPYYLDASDQLSFRKRFQATADRSNRFLQIAINTCSHQADEHRCGITQRWFHPATAPEARDPAGNWRGRNERGLPATAGRVAPYEAPGAVSGTGSTGTFLSRACSNGNFIAGILRELAREVEKVIADHAIPAGGALAAALAFGAGGAVATIASICGVLAAAVVALDAAADLLDALGDVSLVQAVDTVIKAIESLPGVPDEIKIMALRTIFLQIFENQQGTLDRVAISYAVMDTHDYLDRSCYGNAESIEIFFDAQQPDKYCAYIDAVLAFETAQQEQKGRFTAGYISLRYTQGSQALIGPAQFAETAVIEVAGIRDAAGALPFIMNAVRLARQPLFAGCFHWGQYNPLTVSEVERLYDVAPEWRLSRWRKALYHLTQHGTLDGFSSAFTRQTGLEP